MPTQGPNNTATEPLQPGEETTGASILGSDAGGLGPGGGGMIGGSGPAAAGDTRGGTAPNAPIDVPTPFGSEEGNAAGEAALQGIAVAPPEPGHESR